MSEIDKMNCFFFKFSKIATTLIAYNKMFIRSCLSTTNVRNNQHFKFDNCSPNHLRYMTNYSLPLPCYLSQSLTTSYFMTMFAGFADKCVIKSRFYIYNYDHHIRIFVFQSSMTVFQLHKN